MDETHDRADDPHRRCESPCFFERCRASSVAGGHPVDLGLEDVTHELRIDAVDHQLEPLLGELVLDLVDLRIEREQSLSSRLLGERDQQLDATSQVGRLGAHHQLEQAGDALHAGHPDARHRRSPRADHDDDDRGHVDERGGAGPLHHRAEQDSGRRGSDPYASCRLHVPVIGRAIETFTLVWALCRTMSSRRARASSASRARPAAPRHPRSRCVPRGGRAAPR